MLGENAKTLRHKPSVIPAINIHAPVIQAEIHVCFFTGILGSVLEKQNSLIWKELGASIAIIIDRNIRI
ncbi:hypothetical protein GCM10008940_18520 [Microbulbifer agarilyticus]